MKGARIDEAAANLEGLVEDARRHIHGEEREVLGDRVLRADAQELELTQFRVTAQIERDPAENTAGTHDRPDGQLRHGDHEIVDVKASRVMDDWAILSERAVRGTDSASRRARPWAPC